MKRTFELGDAPIDSDYVNQMNAVARSLDLIFNGPLKGADKHTGFILLVFPFGQEASRCNYISNGISPEDVIALMREMVAKYEPEGTA